MAGRPDAFRLDIDDDTDEDAGGAPGWEFADIDYDAEEDAGGAPGWEFAAPRGSPTIPLARWQRIIRHLRRVWALRRLWGHLGGALRRYRALPARR